MERQVEVSPGAAALALLTRLQMDTGRLGEAGTGEAPAVHLAAPHGS